MDVMTFKIKSFGVFRKFGDTLSIQINKGASILDIKQALIDSLGSENKTLIEESVLANDNDILPNTYILEEETALSILPPVCGG